MLSADPTSSAATDRTDRKRLMMAVVPHEVVNRLAIGSMAELDHPALPSVTAVLAEDDTGRPVQPLTFQRLKVGEKVMVLADHGGGDEGRSLVVRVLYGEQFGKIFRVDRHNLRPL
jgi:hypothetical protein